jgi:hypothetical protein
MISLSRTKRCRLFEKIANDTWFHIIRNHRTGTQVNEPGKTNDIIAEIRDNHLSYPNIGVWAINGFREIVYGSDIDIFVETESGHFVWWALQAKVLRLEGNYDGVSTLRGGEYQWVKLNRLKASAGCEVRYLLYNGVDGFIFNGEDICKRDFSQEQFGCSLVNTTDMERVALAKTPVFKDFHPELAQPWRIITCCLYPRKSKNTVFYSTSQIRAALRYYPEMIADNRIFTEQYEEEALNELPLDAINNFSEESGRKPPFRMVIRTTSSLSNLKFN